MWLAQENGKLQLKNMASMILPEKAFMGVGTNKEFESFALIFICGVLTFLYFAIDLLALLIWLG